VISLPNREAVFAASAIPGIAVTRRVVNASELTV
jgi:hypothetical protein